MTTGASKSAFSFNSHAGILPGPEALAGFSDESFLNTHDTVTEGGFEYCISAEAPGTSGIKELMGARKVSLIMLAKVLGLDKGSWRVCFKINFGSVRVVDCIPPML